MPLRRLCCSAALTGFASQEFPLVMRSFKKTLMQRGEWPPTSMPSSPGSLQAPRGQPLIQSSSAPSALRRCVSIGTAAAEAPVPGNALVTGGLAPPTRKERRVPGLILHCREPEVCLLSQGHRNIHQSQRSACCTWRNSRITETRHVGCLIAPIKRGDEDAHWRRGREEVKRPWNALAALHSFSEDGFQCSTTAPGRPAS